MDCHQKIKLAAAADLLLAQQVNIFMCTHWSICLLVDVYVHLSDIIVTNSKGNENNDESDKYDFEQAEAEKAKALAPPPPPGPLIDRST